MWNSADGKASLSNVFYNLKKTRTQEKNQWTEKPRTDTDLAQYGERRKLSWKCKTGEITAHVKHFNSLRTVEKVFEEITAKKTNLMKILTLIQEAQQIPSGLLTATKTSI